MTEKNKEQENEQAEQVEIIEEIDQEIDDKSTEEDKTSDEKYQQAVKEKEELFDRHVRLQAEYDNFRKRTQKEKAADLTYKSQTIVTELLPVLDDFERALMTAPEDGDKTSFVDGMKIIYRQLNTVLEAEGVEAIPAVGEEFDPTMHQAIATVNDEQYETNVVVEELQKGYQLKDRVIRPAMVKVNQ